MCRRSSAAVAEWPLNNTIRYNTMRYIYVRYKMRERASLI